MKKRNWMVALLVLTLGILAAGSAMARGGAADGWGQRGYNCWAAEGAADVDIEKVVQFRKETLPLRDQLLTRKLELSREYGKENPDAEVIGKLRKEMIDIQTSIDKVAEGYGLGDFGPKRGLRGGSGPGCGSCPQGSF